MRPNAFIIISLALSLAACGGLPDSECEEGDRTCEPSEDEPGAYYGDNYENGGNPNAGNSDGADDGTTDDGTGTDDGTTDDATGTGTEDGPLEQVDCTVVVTEVNHDYREHIEWLDLWVCDLNDACQGYYDVGHELISEDPDVHNLADFTLRTDGDGEIDAKFGGFVYWDETDLDQSDACWGSQDTLWDCDYDYIVGSNYVYINIELLCDTDGDAGTDDEVFTCASDGADLVCGD